MWKFRWYETIQSNERFKENFYIELKECPCENKDQLRKREGEFIREYQTGLNKLKNKFRILL